MYKERGLDAMNTKINRALSYWIVQRGVIDTRHITTGYFPLAAVNEALDYIKTRGDKDPVWPMYSQSNSCSHSGDSRFTRRHFPPLSPGRKESQKS
jgi:hypothetical protein